MHAPLIKGELSRPILLPTMDIPAVIFNVNGDTRLFEPMRQWALGLKTDTGSVCRYSSASGLQNCPSAQQSYVPDLKAYVLRAGHELGDRKRNSRL
jgi:hypothetical protein